MLLLSGFTPGSASSNLQIVAWVPVEVASSPDQAVALSSRAYIEASANAYAQDEEDRQHRLNANVRNVTGQPYGNDGVIRPLVQLIDLVAGHTPNLIDAPGFMRNSDKVYGPIFIGAWGSHSLMNLILILIAAGLGIAYWLWRQEQKLNEQRHKRWLRFPIVDDYVERHGVNRNGQKGITCRCCGSRSIRQLGLDGWHDQRRIHQCNHCNASLYRSYR